MPDIEYKVCVPKWVCPFSLLAVVLPEVGWALSTFLDNSLSTYNIFMASWLIGGV